MKQRSIVKIDGSQMHNNPYFTVLKSRFNRMELHKAMDGG